MNLELNADPATWEAEMKDHSLKLLPGETQETHLQNKIKKYWEYGSSGKAHVLKAWSLAGGVIER
jgi:hypothetical protein